MFCEQRKLCLKFSLDLIVLDQGQELEDSGWSLQSCFLILQVVCLSRYTYSFSDRSDSYMESCQESWEFLLEAVKSSTHRLNVGRFNRHRLTQ